MLGLKCLRAYHIASLKTKRPSASVLSISTLKPSAVRTTSPGATANCETIFAAMPITATTFLSALAIAIALTVPSTAAAPAMSDFIRAIDAPVLIL